MKYAVPEIDRGVPMPPIRARYRWWELEVGDSLWFSDRKSKDINVLRCAAQKRYGIKLTQRRLNDGVRVWRVA